MTIVQQPGTIGQLTPQPSDFLIVLASAAGFCIYEAVNAKVTYGLLFSVAKGRTDEMKQFFTKKACLNFYKMTYFTFATIWGYYVLKPTGWLPWHIGGSLSINEGFDIWYKDMPFAPVPRSIQIYGLVTFGFHLGDWFAMAFFRDITSDYNEMTLHHIATFGCYFAMIANNQRLGYVAFYLHDIADIFTTMGRTLSSTKLESLIIFCVVCLLSSWVWTRLIVLPQILFRLVTTPVNECMFYIQTLNMLQISMLQLMHVYWFYLIAGMAAHKLRTGKTEDTQNAKVKQK